jgi:hypothetical protein
MAGGIVVAGGRGVPSGVASTVAGGVASGKGGFRLWPRRDWFQCDCKNRNEYI